MLVISRFFYGVNKINATAALLIASLPSVALAAMVAIEDEQLASITGQSLLVTDYIAPSGDPGGPRDFGFYRMGLDAEVALNMNIDKLQLGCGGFNESVRTGCDIDMDYVRFMGRYTGGGSYNPNQFSGGTYDGNNRPDDGHPRAGDPATSSFLLHRPYIELAIKEGNTTTLREVAGLKVSAEWADGFFGVGRYESASDTHSGINSMSGFLDVYLSGYARFTSTFGNGQACIGRPTGYSDCASNDEFYDVPAIYTLGTRMTELFIPGVELKNLHGAGGLLSLFNGSDLYAQMRARLIELHGFEVAQAEDFFVSFQREAIEYPTYAHATNGGQHSVTANLGWWMNVPRVELKDLEPATIPLGCPGFACLGLLEAFSYPGIDAGYPDMRSRPPV
ncbi:MAG: hypothetical protein MI867_27680, partial [Pseudomonadales bacterium]|nr:hypothetical protein [Pseudomonadales bacterium]